MKKITKRQSQILEFIKSFYRKNGLPPTVREIADRYKMKSSSMFDHLYALQKKGFLTRTSNKSRSIQLTEFQENKGRILESKEVPILGRVAAGRPLLAVENIEGTVTIDRNWVTAEDAFALQVKGDSMIDTHILDGDIVLVKKQTEANKGNIVVALIGEEATVKTFYREKNRIRLQPENKDMEPIYVDPQSPDFQILGIVTGVLRKF
jgi:repressor LexA